MLTLLLLLLMAQPTQVGAIHVLVEAGDTILLDARSMGISTTAAGGMLITEVPVGEHEIIVRTPAGGVATTKVNVTFGETSTVSISSLGLRTRVRGTDSTVEMQVTPKNAPCALRVGIDEATGHTEELRIEHVRPGPQKVALACGDRRATGDFDIPPGKIVTMAADLTTHQVRIVNERDRVTSVVVPTIADAIMRLDLPFLWKRAVAASLPPNMTPKSMVQKGMRLEATFIAPDYATAYALASQLKDRPEVESVNLAQSAYAKDGIVFKFIIVFRTM